jgi:hypothetical protein
LGRNSTTPSGSDGLDPPPGGWKSRQGSPRRPGHGGSPVGTLTPGTTGRVSRDGLRFEWAIATLAVPFGRVSPNDQIGWSPFGAEIVTRMREPAR